MVKSVARRNNTILLGKTFKKITRKGTRKKKTTSRLTTNQIGIKQGSNERRRFMKLVACGCGPFK